VNARVATAQFIANNDGIDAQMGATLDASQQKKDERLSDPALCAIVRASKAWIIFRAAILIGRAQNLREPTAQKNILSATSRAVARSVR
jgi:hypothetical protein